MTPFTVYDSATGEVLSTGVADDLGALAAPGVTVIAEQGPTRGYREGGTWKTQPPRPSPNHTWDWAAKQWLDRRTAEDKWAQVRQKRDRIFAATVDRVSAVRWDDMTPEQRRAWKTYRQALKDITTQSDPDAVVWPVPPSD